MVYQNSVFHLLGLSLGRLSCRASPRLGEGSKVAIVDTRLNDARVLVGHCSAIRNHLTLNIAAVLGQLRDLVSTTMVDKDFAVAHRKTCCGKRRTVRGVVP